MKIRVTVPSLLADSIGGERHFVVDAATLVEALVAIQTDHPNLARHVWDESGTRRQHVLIYLNDESIEWIPDHAHRVLNPSDELSIIQAVSGG